MPVTTTVRSKEDAYGFIKLLIQQRRLEIPRSAASLLRQLAGLEFETTESGVTRLHVPERVGHDDMAVALALAVSQLQGNELIPVDNGVYEHADVWSDADEIAYQMDLAGWLDS